MIISTPQPEATEVGFDILTRGGNAVDAAVATAFVQGVVDPQMCGIAGFGSMHIFLPERGVHTLIDFHGKTPLSATPAMWEHLLEGEARDGFGFVLRGAVNDVGYQSVTTPGTLLALVEALSEYGTMDLADVIAPAIAQAEAGVVVRPHMHFFWTNELEGARVLTADRLAHTASGRRIYFQGDRLKRIGDRLDNPDLAETLRTIARDGADAFYRGAIASRMDEDMRANDGLLSAHDLAAYATTRTEPLWGTFGRYRVASNHPPGGGLMLLQMLQALDRLEIVAMGHNSPDYIVAVAEVMKRATADKDAFVGDPAFVDVPVARLLSSEHAEATADAVRRGEVVSVERVAAPTHTTHVAVLDDRGGAVSVTHSLGMPSGVITEGLGFMYNGCMGVFDPRPGRAGSIAPGKSRFSSICPSIVFDGEEPVLVIGAPGGTQIAMGVLQVTLNALAFDMPILEAVSAARFSATSDAIDVSNRIPRRTEAALRERGYAVNRSPLSYGFGAVHALKRDGGKWTGAADPGHDGMVMAA